jgi:uncharacterized membrane protein YraQ (UPF0718 family)
VPLYAALSFMLAAPVVNPVVMLSTAVAFQGNLMVVALRMGMTLSVAITVSLLVRGLLPAARGQPTPPAVLRGGSLNTEPPLRVGGRIARLFAYASAEFFDVAFFVLLGALFTAATQTFVPRGELTALGANPLGSVVALMPMATILSICSEADAFVARAFATTFSLGAVLAFMTVGQIVDLRNGPLLLRTVGGPVVLLIVAVSYSLIFLEALAINAVRASL